MSFSVAPDGAPDPGDPVLMVNADQAMPPGSTIGVTLLAAYAREVDEGRLDPNDVIPVREWERFYLPDAGVGKGAHAAALAGLGLPANPDGSAVDSVLMDGEI